MKKNANMQTIRKVAVAVNLSNASWRDFLTGFFDYAKRNTHWDIRVVQSIEELERTAPGCQGIVTGLKPSPRILAVCDRNAVPLVAIGADWALKRKNGVLAYIRNDNEDIGRFCAKHFQTLGNFSSVGFVPSNNSDDWSAAREKGFLDSFRAVVKSTFRAVAEPGSDKDIAELADWLKSLPKPTAIMAAWDMRAVHVLSACRLAHLKVPGQVAVIGVDNDPLLCDFTTPPLTSVAPDHILEGQLAAKTIDRMMHYSTRRAAPPFTHLNTAKKMVERESAQPVSPVTSLIARALAFIDGHAAENIKTADVVAALGVSRSLLDLRFREFRNETVAQAITSRRLAEVARRLRSTNLSIRAISADCGFGNVNHLKNLFKRKFGMPMRDWRKSKRQAQQCDRPINANHARRKPFTLPPG